MKLIIDIDEDYYKKLCEKVKRFGKGSAILSRPEKIIFNGIPLSEELEKIKAEFEDKILLNQTVAMQIIDNHISELKGDDKPLN